MKILMVNYEFPPIGGGGANANLALLKEYALLPDLNVDVLTSAPKPGLITEKFSENITIYKVGIHKKDLHHWRKKEVIEWLIKAGFEYRRLINKKNYNLAHAFFAFPTAWLCWRNRNKLPYMISFRGSDVPGKNVRLKLDYKILAPVFKKIWKKASMLIACSEGLKQRALRFYPSVSIRIIVNGVDTDMFCPAETLQRADEFKLITVGRLSETKRIDMLVRAVEILLADRRKVRLLIVGAGAQQQKLRDMVKNSRLDKQIEFAGRLEPEQLPQLYRQSDIYVSATMQEGMSNAMLEAMASSLPIVTTDCEGLDELIDDNGIVVQQDSAGRIAEAVRKLMDDTEMYQRMPFSLQIINKKRRHEAAIISVKPMY